jgi:hypothetical protein
MQVGSKPTSYWQSTDRKQLSHQFDRRTVMKIQIEIPDYSAEKGFQFVWEKEFSIYVQATNGEAYIRADQGGLVSLARHILALAYAPVDPGYHFHLDEYNSLDTGSCQLTFEKK